MTMESVELGRGTVTCKFEIPQYEKVPLSAGNGRVAVERCMNELVFNVIEVNVIFLRVVYAPKHESSSVRNEPVKFKPYVAHWKKDGDSPERHFLSHSNTD